MATIGIQHLALRQIYPASGTPGTPQFPEANSTDFVRGEPVYMVSGYLTKFAVGANNLWGVAADDAANSASAVSLGYKKRAVVLDPYTQVWEANVRNDDDGDADDAIAATDLGSSYGIIESTVSGATNKWCINKADTTNKRVTIVGFVDDVGDIYGRVLFRWIAAYLQPYLAN